LPEKVRGTKQEGLMAGWDWYRTYATLAGVDPTDHKAAAAGLPPIDSHDLWPLLSGKVSVSPRTELAIGDVAQVGGLISGGYKILLGRNAQAVWTGPQFPNVTSHNSSRDPGRFSVACGNTSATGCLYHIATDPGEHINLAAKQPELWHQMMARLLHINETFFAPDRGSKDPAACDMATTRWKGFWGPWIDLPPLDLIE